MITIGLCHVLLSLLHQQLKAPAPHLTVTRSGANKGTMSVQIATTNGTALNGVHYAGLTNTLDWNDGDSTPRLVTVRLSMIIWSDPMSLSAPTCSIRWSPEPMRLSF